MNRDFTSRAPNTRWVADFTYVPTSSGFVHTAFVADIYSRVIVAWHSQTTMTYDLVLTPVRIAIWDQERKGHPIIDGELLHHSDTGSQYTAIAFVEHLAVEGIMPSIGTVAHAYALTGPNPQSEARIGESTIGLYTLECIDPGPFHQGSLVTAKEVEYIAMEWARWHNHARPHPAANYAISIEIEHNYYQHNQPPHPER